MFITNANFYSLVMKTDILMIINVYYYRQETRHQLCKEKQTLVFEFFIKAKVEKYRIISREITYQ